MLEVILTPEAHGDIWNTANWYENQRHNLGQHFLDEILETQDRLLQHPMMYPVLHKNVRRVIVRRFPFAVYYIIREQIVIIIAVLHMRRNPEIWKKRI